MVVDAKHANLQHTHDMNLPLTLLDNSWHLFHLKVKVKGAMPQLGRRRGAHLPLAAVKPVGG